MELMVLPEKLAQKMMYHHLNKKTSVISITCKNEKDVDFAENDFVDKIFRMKFNDTIKDEYTEDGFLIEAPVANDFTGLKKFVDSLSCDLLIIHCGAGYSRSAAVGAAINEYLGLDYEFFNNDNFAPNLTVYDLCKKEFGIAKNKEYYESVFDFDDSRR